jgi:hypothetical protein
MALFSRAYSIRVIAGSLALDPDGDPSQPDGVRVEVELPEGSRLNTEVPVEDLGIPIDLPGIDRALREDIAFALPTQFTEPLRAALGSTPPGEPVFVEFRRPFGYLPVLPWERILRPALTVPLLRLPFTSVPAVSGTDLLEIAVCAPATGTPLVAELLRAFVADPPMRTHVNLFAAPGDGPLAVPAGLDVTVHQPPASVEDTPALSGPEAPVGSPDELENPWLRWIVEAIAPGSIDVMHVIAPGRLSRNFGLLDLGASPTGGENPRELRLVSAGQLLSCLTQLGAWSVGLTSVGVGEAALRLIAHRMSGLLSGPVLMHAPRPGSWTDLAAAHRFLSAPETGLPPVTSALTISCHPAWVQAASSVPGPAAKDEALEREIIVTAKDCTLDKGVTGQELRGPVEPPAWLAANQRLLERWTSGLIGTETEPLPAEHAATGVSQALKFISSTIEDTVRERGGSR